MPFSTCIETNNASSAEDAAALVLAGAQFLNGGDREQAEAAWRKALQGDHRCVPALALLLELLIASKRTSEAVEILERLASVVEKTAQSLYALAQKSCLLKQYEQGRKLLKQAAQLNPSPKVRTDISILLAQLEILDRQWESALRRVNEVLKDEPEHLEAIKTRQRCWYELSYAEEDAADLRLAMKLAPDADKHSRLLFKMNFLASSTPEELYAESRRWDELYAAPLAGQILPHTNSADPERRLRVGYFSPNFNNHAIMRLLPGVFAQHDPEKFEIFAYSASSEVDEFTELAKGSVRNFVSLPPSRDEIAKRVRADGIDILVDLAGHTMQADTLLAFALKPAPVQVSWMGAMATTGLCTMDYFLGDAFVPCPGTEQFFSEKIMRLPHGIHCCYRPLTDVGLAGFPCIANGYVTFGCFNSPRKITREVVKLWARILNSHPGSKMLMKYMNLDHPLAQRRLRQWFFDDGIDGSRLEFQGASGLAEYMAVYNGVDVALDPFPYNGGTTTMDALWMGVPVVSMYGRLAVNSCGASILSAVGLPVAHTPDQYISQAVDLAHAIREKPQMRQEVRAAMLKSPLMDEAGLMRSVEDAYRQMWRRWCRGRLTEN